MKCADKVGRSSQSCHHDILVTPKLCRGKLQGTGIPPLGKSGKSPPTPACKGGGAWEGGLFLRKDLLVKCDLIKAPSPGYM